MRFCTGTMFPEAYRNQFFIARRGSWNRERLRGYDVVVVHLDASGNVTRVGREQMPRIIHQREEFLARTLGEYRSGQRVGADPPMNGAVVGLTNADIAALAHYLAHRD